ncbi:hypothetical protein CGRA01v4_01218 [Colletotrichum graminicola]|uniref:Uncharacterized protein n=1 Tax=Colletotrichum graminicola (strain M1.001 / M2 / FGSC 10212) TaxID=645133 RepID=E3QGD8_COLGM|nr:uncharacterized protein GLRG_05070 [Colletotrichum graminicola M1.001]EFQ29926.1 hypothetical protein GLRG_05070 [Colletotrichum graminicola M1.001]WDK09938.1 hypothetical protein CGRA01v4_01218 [Colletotrichum graminicola]
MTGLGNLEPLGGISEPQEEEEIDLRENRPSRPAAGNGSAGQLAAEDGHPGWTVLGRLAWILSDQVFDRLPQELFRHEQEAIQVVIFNQPMALIKVKT